ncbi:MAG TPA: Ku protein [Rhodanobacteraceae bacterium]|nr:Ku protein [Rhodanobacteraceae bacterium]
MAGRPIWSGTISFGLLNIPVQLLTAERHTDLHFRMLDSRNNARIRYERINEETGEEVPWKDIVKAFEYDKGSYVVLEKEDFAKAAPESTESVDIEAFVNPDSIGAEYFEKPYYLVPAKKAEKGYVLLRETLKRLKTAGLARVVIRTREYLALVLPRDEALLLMLLRFPQELVPADEYAFPDKKPAAYRISAKELEMAESLVKSMVGKWQPQNYHDDFRERLVAVIEERVKAKGVVRTPTAAETELPKNAATNVVDFMSLLKKSIDAKQRTPARDVPTGKAPAKSAKATTRKRPARKRKAS